MKPRILHQLTYQFDPVYFRPDKPGRIAEGLFKSGLRNPAEQDDGQPVAHRKLDRRCGIERRNRRRPVLLDTRSPHARRKQRPPVYQDETDAERHGIGIDVYT